MVGAKVSRQTIAMGGDGLMRMISPSFSSSSLESLLLVLVRL
jgi:hypothetical protein